MSIITGLKERLRRGLGSRRAVVVITAIALLLVAATMGNGLLFDDYLHRHRLTHQPFYSPDSSSIMELFVFTDGDAAKTQAYMDQGLVPWWTYTGLHIAFARPLSAVTHWLDYQWWPRRPALMHLHSLLWFAAMVLAAALVYRRFHTPAWAAGLAALLFALDDAHGVPVGWLANRNVLVAAVFGFAALYCHDRWRRDGWRPGAFAGPGLFVLALLSGESALAIGAYVFSYELFISRGRWVRRAMAVLLYAVPAGIWYVAYSRMDFGTHGSGLYIDPGHAPLAFLKALVVHFPLLQYGQWFLPDGAAFASLPASLAPWVLAGVYLLLAALAALFLPLLKCKAVVRFWALGMLMSTLPISATYPSNRTLVFVGLGGMGILGQFFASRRENPEWWAGPRLWRLGARGLSALLVFVHLIAAPLLLPLAAVGMKAFSRDTIERPLMDLAQTTSLAGKTVVFINPPVTFSAFDTPLYCEELGIPAPERSYVLASGDVDHLLLKRMAADALELTSAGGFIAKYFDKLFRGSTRPMHSGQQVEMGGIRVEVLEMTEDQRPLRVRFTFPTSLEDSALAFFQWRDNGFAPFRMPAVGQSVRLERVRMKHFGK